MRKFLLSSFALLMSVAMMAVGAGDGTNKANAIDFDWTSGNIHEAPGALWYCVDLAPVNAAAEPALVLYLTNLSDEEAAVDVQISLAGSQRTVSYNIAAEGYYRMDLPIAQFREFITVDQVNLALQSNQKIALSAKVYEFPEYVKEAIANSEPIDWNSGVKQDALSTKWYEVDITSLKTEKQHLQVGFINHEASKKALLTATFVLRGENITLPLVVPAGFSTTKVIDYQLLAKLPVNRIHVGVTTDSPIEVVTSTRSAIADDPTPCLNAINAEHGVTYVHEAGDTQWYKISLDLLKSTDAFSSFYLANKGNQRANVTIGMVPDCQYTTGTKITLPIPAGFELGALAPNILGNLIEELTRFESAYNKVDAKDVYLEIKTDQPIHFGLDVTNAATNPCLREDLVTFDWATGAKIEAGKATWFDMELDAVRNLGSHINFTFTNHADSIVWVATVVSVDCPAKVTMPLLVPVPAHASVDQLVDYSILDAINIDNIYVGVKADGPVELKATAVNAEVIPSAGCENATVLGSGEYTQNPGTKWYQLPMSLFDEVGAAAKLSFKNLTGSTATLSAGVTVGCEYAIAHRAKVKVPKSIDLSINVPKRILNFARQFVDNDVENFYLQLTTDKAIKFSIDLQAPDVDACREAVEFDWAAWEKDGLHLEANQDKWYKVNLDYLFNKLENGEDLVVNLVNGSEDMDVHVLASVSPTCPALLSVEKSVDIPAGSDLYKVFTYEEVMKYVGQYDKYIYDGELEMLLGQLATYKVYNKMVELLERTPFAKFIPFGQVDLLLEAYGDHLTIAGIKDIVNNYEKYLSVAQLKEVLKTQKEYVSLQDAITLIEKYGDYIPYVDAEKILNNYEKYLPAAGGVASILKKCEKYITHENLQKVVDRCKQYLPIEEMKVLINRLKQYLPENNSCYVNIKTTGELIVKPDDPEPPTPEEPCCPEECEDVEVLDWKMVKLSNVELNKLYKLDITDLYEKKQNINFFVTNDVHSDTVVIASEIYAHCQDATPVAQHSNKVKTDMSIAKVAYDKFAELVDSAQCCMFVKFTAFDTIPVTPDTPVCEDVKTEFSAKFCENPYIWNGVEYAVAGDYIQSFPLASGCDSIVTLHLTKECPQDPECVTVYGEFDATFCEQYNWNGVIYTKAGDYDQTFVAVTGCDSIVTMHLTEDCEITDECEDVETEFTAYFCESFTWNKEVYTKAGDYKQVLSKTDGCDSIVTLHLIEDCEPIVPPTPEDPCADAELISWTDVVNIPATSGKWYKIDVRTAVESGKDIKFTVINGDEPNKVNVKFNTECFIVPDEPVDEPTDEPVEPANTITVRAKVPDYWTDQIYVWVWPDGGNGVEYVAEKDGDWWSYTHEGEYVNIIFKNGQTWAPDYQTIDMRFTSDACLQLGGYAWDDQFGQNKISYVEVPCDSHAKVAPYEIADEYNEFNSVFAANETKSTIITTELIEAFNIKDYVYAYVTTTGSATAYAELVEDEPIIPGDDCEHATLLDWRKGVRLSQLSAGWYKLYVGDVHANQESVTAKVINDLTCKATVTAYSYAHCESDEALSSDVAKTFKLGETVKTVSYADFSDVVAPHLEYVYVNVISIVEDCEPIEPGEDCEHAILLDWSDVKLSQLVEGNWYKLDFSEVQANQSSATFKATNDLNGDASVSAVAYYHCEDTEAMGNATKNLVQGHVGEREVSYKELTDMIGQADVLYVQVTDITVAGEDCEHAIALDWSDVKLSQLVEGNWYKLDFSEVHANQLNPTFKATNDLNGDASVSAVAYYHCEDTEAMGNATKKLAQGHVGEREVSYKELTDMIGQAEVLYVQVTDITVAKVDPCADIPEIDWTKGIKLSQLQEGAMYKLNVASVHEGKADVMVSVENDLTCKTRVAASAYYDCQDDETFFEGSYAFELGAKEYVVKYDEFQDYVAEYIEYVYVQVDKIECDQPCYETTTILVDSVCDGKEFVDPITGEQHIISTLIPSTLTWNDTIVKEEGCDSIYTIVVDPIVAPDMLTKEELVAIGGAPVLVAGEVVVTDGTEAIIVAHYNGMQSDKNIAHVDSVVWTAGAGAKLACDAVEHTMVLTVYAGCEFVKSATYTFDGVVPVDVVETTETATICEGETYEWDGKQLSETGSYPMEITNAAGCVVEIKTLELTVTPAETVTLAAVEVCDSYEWHGVTYTESGEYTYTENCKTEVLPLTIVKSETVTLAAVEACDSYEWHGVTYTESGEYTYTENCKTEVLPLTIVKSETVTLDPVVACESYEWHGVTYTESGEYTYTDNCMTEVLKLTINTTVTEEITVTECHAYTWRGETYTVSGDYTYEGDCYKEILHLTIEGQIPENNPELAEAEAVAKYGNRLVMLHLNNFVEKYGWTPAAGDVMWYQVNGDVDTSWEVENDTPLGTGYYIDSQEGYTGEVYAVINASTEDKCQNIYRTKVIALVPAGQAPKLMPTIARPSEDLHLMNLNPSNVTEVRVFNTSGELMATYQAEEASEFVFKAATLPGYYMVEVQHNGEQTTLRYIVK